MTNSGHNANRSDRHGRLGRLGRLGRKVAISIGLATLQLLAGCQSNSGDVLAVDPQSPAATAPAQPLTASSPAVLGNGPLRIAFVASGTPGAGQLADIRNGAELAIKGLGEGVLSVEIVTADASGNAANERAVEAFVRGASAIVYVGGAPASSAGSILQLALSGNGDRRPAGSYAFLSSPIDSLEYGLQKAGSAGAQPVYLLASEQLAGGGEISQALARLKATTPVQLVSYQSSAAAASIVAGLQIGAGAAVGFAGNGPEIAALAAAIKAQAGGVQFIGNSSWQQSALLSAPALQGTLVAIADNSNEKLVADKYRQTYGQIPSATALQVYDALAIIAGINRVKGNGGLSDGTIQSPAGFKGATGAFRFKSNGNVERLFSLKKIAGGKLAPVSAAPASF